MSVFCEVHSALCNEEIFIFSDVAIPGCIVSLLILGSFVYL